MKSRFPLVVAAVAVVALLGACSSRAEYRAGDEGVPHWIREGVRLASAEKAGRAPATTDREGRDDDTPTTTAPSGLPSREVVVASLTAAGLSAEQAECVYDHVVADPLVSSEVTAFVTALSTPGGTGGATGAVAGLSPEATTRLVTTVSPCLDQATLVALMAAGQGTGGNTQLQALLNQAQGLDLAALAGFDPAALAQALAGRLGADQVRRLQELLGGVGTPGAGGALAAIDVEGLDISRLTPEETPLLILALLRGLTPAQQMQLLSLTRVDLGDLDLQINPDTLTPEEVGRLLLALSPVLAGTISPTPPDGHDPGQVYVPPGADLSNINPLIFLNRADVIAALQRQGFAPSVAACLFDSLSRLPPTTIAALFTSDAQQSSAALVALTAVRCIAGG